MAESEVIDVDDYELEHPELHVLDDLSEVDLDDGTNTGPTVKEEPEVSVEDPGVESSDVAEPSVEEPADEQPDVEDPDIESMGVENPTNSQDVEMTSEVVEVKQEPSDELGIGSPFDWDNARAISRPYQYSYENDGFEVMASVRQATSIGMGSSLLKKSGNRTEPDAGEEEPDDEDLEEPDDEDLEARLKEIHQRKMREQAEKRRTEDQTLMDSGSERLREWQSSERLTGFDQDLERSVEDDEQKWQAAERKYRGLCSRGENTLRDDIEFKQAESRHLSRLSRPDPISTDDEEDDSRDGDVRMSADHEGTPGFQAREQKRKRAAATRARKDKTREVVMAGMRDEAIQEAREMQKKGKKGKAAKKRQRKHKPPSAKKEHQANIELERMEELREKFQSNLSSNITNLSSNVIDDANASEDEDAPEDPRLSSEGRNRAQKLASLLAEIPKEDLRYAKRSRRELNDACKVFPGRMVRACENENRWEVRGMHSHLLDHQLIGSAWMIERERKPNIRGGLLADEMGFGKTVQALATMIGNKAKEGETMATLIVCPATLVTQWSEEVVKHVKDPGTVWIHKSPNRLRGHDIGTALKGSFCVITTYHEIVLSLKSCECPNELTTEEQIVNWYEANGSNRLNRLGLPHSMRWHRVILDECTAIKNYRSATARACYMLQAKYRWLMSGTPLVNDVCEMYSYALFLRKADCGSSEQFVSNFVDTKSSMERMQRWILTFSLRRTHKDRLFKRRMFYLPKCYKNDISATFTCLEEAIYYICEKRFCFFVNEEVKAFYKENHSEEERRQTFHLGSHRNGHVHNILVLMLRLRQIATHPLLAAETIKKLLLPADREELKDILSTRGSEEQYGAIKELRKHLAAADAKARHQEFYEHELEEIGDGGDFGRSQIAGKSFLKIIDELRDCDEEEVEPLCVFCGLRPKAQPMETSCGHLYCRECLLEHQLAEGYLGKSRAQCHKCGEEYEGSHKATAAKYRSPCAKRKALKRSRENQDLSWIHDYSRPLVPSAKLLTVKAQVTTWLAQDEDAKIIIYTQFLPVISCLERLCRDEGWSFLSYHGKMNHEQRDQAVSNFRDKTQGKKIFLASLKSGGIGLNLTCANKIISLDLWWNYAVENQAFARIFRIGQDRETAVLRVVAQRSIDEKLLEMQERKTAAIKMALNDDNSMPRLTIEELMSLFGEVKRRKEDDVPYVVARQPAISVYRGGDRGQGLDFTEEDALIRAA